MVTGFNKWCLSALIPFIFMVKGPLPVGHPIPVPDGGNVPHPLHLSVSEIDYNATEKSFEITCKLFTDDFENILEKNYKVDIDLINPRDRTAVQKVVNEYIRTHLQLKVDGKAVAFNCIGFERDHEATYCYLEATGLESMKKVEVVNTIMYDLFDDQANIIHVSNGGTRKSTKLNFPAKEAVVQF